MEKASLHGAGKMYLSMKRRMDTREKSSKWPKEQCFSKMFGERPEVLACYGRSPGKILYRWESCRGVQNSGDASKQDF